MTLNGFELKKMIFKVLRKQSNSLTTKYLFYKLAVQKIFPPNSGLFIDVVCAGSGRVTFNNQRSYLKAVCAAFVEIKTPKFTKKVRR